MKKNDRTFREDIRIIRRGMIEFDKILPKQLTYIKIQGVLVSAIPYISTITMALIIDSLFKKVDMKYVVLLCVLGILINFGALILKGYLECRIDVYFQRLFSSHEIALTNKAYHLVYEELEKNKTHKLRDDVSGSINVSGAGMASLYWDMECVFNNSITALIGVILLGKTVYDIVRYQNIQHYFKQGSMYITLASILLLFVISVMLTCKLTSKRFDVAFEVFQHGAKYRRYGDFYSMEYLKDENAAMDIRIYDQENLILSECQSNCYEHFAAGKEKECRGVCIYDGIKVLVSCLCGLVVYVLIGKLAIEGILSCGNILILYTAITMMIGALSDIAQVIVDLRDNNEHLLRFFQYMDLEDQQECSLEGTITITEGVIEFRAVSFSYPESETNVLDDINIVINPGERIAIVGENGSGKTTLIKLLCRLYKPSQGEILLDGKDIWKYPYDEYMNYIATVFQDFALFAFSYADNIAPSLVQDEEKIMDAISKAGLEEKMSIGDKGIHQMITHDFDESGIELSGGEGQKVAIARTVYKDTKLMILDEPTAALDPYAEYEIYKNFDDITKGKTLISISHRLSSCRMCDRILVLSSGRLIQNGSHDELLMNEEGTYYTLWNAQAQYYN